METFKITKGHLKLLKNMHVSWNDCETGAPTIDPKRPYGNSSVADDVHNILTGEEKELTEQEHEEFTKIHEEMETVLQICLIVGTFEAGAYEKYDIFTRSWRKAQ